MMVSLSGGGLSVGGVIYRVSLEEAPAMSGAAGLSEDGAGDVPEANSGLLLLGGGALLLALGAAARRHPRRGER
jgi:hypothetical protein